MAIENLIPNGNSVTSGWGAEGGPSYTSVDDPVGSPDDGATKVYSPTINDLFSVTLADSALTTETVNSVTARIRIFSLDPITNTVQTYLTVGGTDYFSSTITIDTNSSYLDRSYTWSVNPATGLAWTTTELDSIILGIKKINSAGMRCTQMYLEVDYSAGGGSVFIPRSSFIL